MRFSSFLLIIVIIFTMFIFSCKKSPTSSSQDTPLPITETIPPAPTNLELLTLTESLVVLRWKDNSSSETSFELEVGNDSTTFFLLKSLGANVDSVNVAGTFTTENFYYFRVRAKNATSSSLSNIVGKTMFPSPTKLSIQSMTISSASLNWVDNSNFESGFIIEKKINGSFFVVVDSVTSNTNTITINSAFDSVSTYSFRVYAAANGKRSAASNAQGKTLGEWIFVEGGTFSMGRNGEFRDERPVHQVTVKSYYISKFEITVQQYRSFVTATGRSMPDAPSWGWKDNDPMVNVSWDDANKYCEWIRLVKDSTIALPTEAQWEFAARGGKNSQNFPYSGGTIRDNVAWCFNNGNSSTHAVGTKPPNELGIYDMSGNAWEWCYDWFSNYSSSPQVNPKGPAIGSFKVFRGGSWFDYGLGDSDCRVETRYQYTINSRVTDSGFRVVKN